QSCLLPLKTRKPTFNPCWSSTVPFFLTLKRSYLVYYSRNIEGALGLMGCPIHNESSLVLTWARHGKFSISPPRKNPSDLIKRNAMEVYSNKYISRWNRVSMVCVVVLIFYVS